MGPCSIRDLGCRIRAKAPTASNPLEVIEQITCLLFIKRLDDLQTLEELKVTRLKRPMGRRVFPET